MHMYHLFIGGHMHGQIDFIQQNQDYVNTYEQEFLGPMPCEPTAVRSRPIIRYRREQFAIFPTYYHPQQLSLDVFVCDDRIVRNIIAEACKLIGPSGVSGMMRYEREIKSIQSSEDSNAIAAVNRIHNEAREHFTRYLQKHRTNRTHAFNPINSERMMSVGYQLEQWVQGVSIHNGIDRSHGECCPDFSCCHPSLMMDRDERKRYFERWKAERQEEDNSGNSGNSVGNSDIEGRVGRRLAE